MLARMIGISPASIFTGSVPGQEEAPGEALDVGVDGDPSLMPEGVAQHDVGRLSPHARERGELLQVAGHFAAVLGLAQRGADVLALSGRSRWSAPSPPVSAEVGRGVVAGRG